MIRNLPESQSENVTEKVNSFVRDGLKLHTSVATTERKKARNPDENGVVVAKCKNSEDKSKIMKEKSSLKDSRRYNNVFIEHDKSNRDRNIIANLNTIEPRHDKMCLREFPTRPDTNRPAQPQKLARVLKFRL